MSICAEAEKTYDVTCVSVIMEQDNNNNSEVLLGANIYRPDAPLASQEREESEN